MVLKKIRTRSILEADYSQAQVYWIFWEISFLKNNLNNVWSMGSWCYCFKFPDGTRLHWLSFGEISKVKSYKQFKFLVFGIFKWVFRRFVFIWGIFLQKSIFHVSNLRARLTHLLIHLTQWWCKAVTSCQKQDWCSILGTVYK